MSGFRRVVGVVGEVLITAGVIVLLFVLYQLVWTNIVADRAAQAKIDGLEQTWRAGGADAPEFDDPIPDGEAFAILRIPRLGEDYRVPIVQGVTLDDALGEAAAICAEACPTGAIVLTPC